MANTIDISGYTLNPLEQAELSKFIVKQFMQQPTVSQIHMVWQGVKMKEQIALVGRMGKTGILDTACARPTSGTVIPTSQKFWEPANIGDTFINCAASMNSLFKAYFSKINRYAEKFNIEGSDLDKLIIAMVEDSMSKAVLRFAWFGDKAVPTAGAAVAGLKVAGNAKFYNAIDGLWKQIFAGVTATTIKKVAISENAQLTLPLQLALAADKARTTFDAMYALATPELRANPDAFILVSGNLFQNYYQSLVSNGQVYDINILQNGLQTLSYLGKLVINMETVWDTDLFADFVDNTTNNAGYLPNRAVFSHANNLPIATLNEGDLSLIESFWNNIDRQNYTAYGFSIDAKVIQESEIVVAY